VWVYKGIVKFGADSDKKRYILKEDTTGIYKCLSLNDLLFSFNADTRDYSDYQFIHADGNLFSVLSKENENLRREYVGMCKRYSQAFIVQNKLTGSGVKPNPHELQKFVLKEIAGQKKLSKIKAGDGVAYTDIYGDYALFGDVCIVGRGCLDNVSTGNFYLIELKPITLTIKDTIEGLRSALRCKTTLQDSQDVVVYCKCEEGMMRLYTIRHLGESVSWLGEDGEYLYYVSMKCNNGMVGRINMTTCEQEWVKAGEDVTRSVTSLEEKLVADTIYSREG
jgi:hypothetical protein